jgi:hypothetical protein
MLILFQYQFNELKIICREFGMKRSKNYEYLTILDSGDRAVGRVLRSYGVVPCIQYDGVTYLEDRNYSSTTSKHIGQFLEVSSKERAALLKDGTFKVMGHLEFSHLEYYAIRGPWGREYVKADYIEKFLKG